MRRYLLTLAVACAALSLGCPAKKRGRCSDKGIEGIGECKKQCEKGDPEACREAGDLLWDEDIGSALQFYDRACTANDDRACDNLAYTYTVGRGTAVDLRRAVEIAEPGCAKGRGHACFLLVQAAEEAGRDTAAARDRAIDAFKKECDANRGGAAGRAPCWELAVLGWLPVDEAMKYAKLACDRGESDVLCKDDNELRAFIKKAGSR